MSEIQGGCRCGAVRYMLVLDALPRTYACHCRDCQTWSGSAFSQQTFLPEAALRVTGPVVIYEMTSPSGRIAVWLAPSVVLRAACATPITFWAISRLPRAASLTLREISEVVAVCSSTALAIVLWISLI